MPDTHFKSVFGAQDRWYYASQHLMFYKEQAYMYLLIQSTLSPWYSNDCGMYY